MKEMFMAFQLMGWLAFILVLFWFLIKYALTEYKPSNIQGCASHPVIENCCVYLFEIRGNDGFKFLKVGYSQDVRARDFKLNGSKRLIDIIHFDSYQDGYAYEQFIHEKLMDCQLPTRLARRYMKNGWTECYYQGTIHQLPRY